MSILVALLSFVACGTPETPVVASPAVEGAAAPAAAPAAAAGEEHFGTPFTQTASVKAKDLLADPKAKVGQTVLVEGRVSDVCQKAGCWMVITDDASNGAMMRVRMKDHGFSVAKDASGTMARVEGVVVEKPADAEEAAHFKSEAAKPEVQPEVAGQSTFEIEAVAVSIQRGA
jgi:hypothetical protein